MSSPSQNPPPSGSISGRSKAASAARIRQAAVQTFGEIGFHATTTRHIADLAGLSPAAMYVYYRSKEQLLYELTLTGHRDAFTCIARAQEPADPELRLRAAVRSFAAWHARNRTLARVAQYELASLSPAHYARIAELRRNTTGALATRIQYGIDRGAFAPRDPAGSTLAILSLCIDIARWFPTATHRDPEALASLYEDLAIQLVAPT